MAGVRHRVVGTLLLPVAHLPAAVALAGDIAGEVARVAAAAETARLALLGDESLHTQRPPADVFSLHRSDAIGDFVVEGVSVEVRLVLVDGEVQGRVLAGSRDRGGELHLDGGRPAGQLRLPVHAHRHRRELVPVLLTESLELDLRGNFRTQRREKAQNSLWDEIGVKHCGSTDLLGGYPVRQVEELQRCSDGAGGLFLVDDFDVRV